MNPGAPVTLSVTVQGSDVCASSAYVPTNGSSGASLCVPTPANTSASGYTTERSIGVLLQRPSSFLAVARNAELHVGARALHVGVQLLDATGRTVRALRARDVRHTTRGKM